MSVMNSVTSCVNRSGLPNAQQQNLRFATHPPSLLPLHGYGSQESYGGQAILDYTNSGSFKISLSRVNDGTNDFSSYSPISRSSLIFTSSFCGTWFPFPSIQALCQIVAIVRQPRLIFSIVSF